MEKVWILYIREGLFWTVANSALLLQNAGRVDRPEPDMLERVVEAMADYIAWRRSGRRLLRRGWGKAPAGPGWCIWGRLWGTGGF